MVASPGVADRRLSTRARRGRALICPAEQGPEARLGQRGARAGAARSRQPAGSSQGQPGAGKRKPARGAVRGTPPSAMNLKQVKGQETAKRALEIAAAGGHKPADGRPAGDRGKSLLASCLPGILPDLSPAEALRGVDGAIGSPETLEAGRIKPAPARSARRTIRPAWRHLTGGGVESAPRRGQSGASGRLVPRRVARIPAPGCSIPLRQPPWRRGGSNVARANAHVYLSRAGAARRGG